MKKYLLLIASLVALAACGQDNPTGPEPVALSADKTSLEFAAEGGSQTVTVTASETVFLVPADDWVSARKGTASGNETLVTVTVEENTVAEERESRISVVAGEDRIYIEVNQAAAEIVVPSTDYPENDGSHPWQVMERLGMGWNLGNHFDSHVNGVASETGWGNPAATQTTFDKVAAAGYKTVRIPVTWLGHIGEAPDYTIDAAWMDRVYEVVGYAENAGLNAIINIHHDGADSAHWLDIAEAATSTAANDRIKSQIAAVWTQIAQKFADKGNFLIFESFNEIHDGRWGWGSNLSDGGAQYRCLNEWNQTFVDAVRATGGNNASRYLAVPGYCTNPNLTVNYFEMPEDTATDRIIVAVHYYDPNTYTLTAQYSEWGHTATPGRHAGDNEEEAVKTTFSSLYSKFISAGIPVYIGEMGCVNRATTREQAFQRYWFEYVVKAAKTYGMPAIVWDNGAAGTGEERHAFIDHGTGEFCSEGARLAVETMVEAMNNDDSGYTLDTVYDNAPQ